MTDDAISMVVSEAMGTVEPLTLKLRGGGVRRYHVEPIPAQQNVAEHSWRVAVIIHHLWPEASGELILAALYHDVAEAFTGDIPGQIKRLDRAQELCVVVQDMEDRYEENLGISFELTERDRLRLQVCDCLELVLYITGLPLTRRTHQIIANGVAYVREAAAKMLVGDSVRVTVLLEQILTGKVA